MIGIKNKLIDLFIRIYGESPEYDDNEEQFYAYRKISVPFNWKLYQAAYLDATMILVGNANAYTVVQEAQKVISKKFALHMRVWPDSVSYTDELILAIIDVLEQELNSQ